MVSMKFALLLLTSSLSVFASPVGDIPKLDINGKPFQGISRRVPTTGNTQCQNNLIVKALKAPRISAQVSSFCSTYIRSTTTVTNTKTMSQASTVQATITDTVTKIQVTTPPVPTTTVYKTTRCRLVGFGTSAYSVGSAGGSDNFAACKAACANNAACVSFGYGASQCALYNVDAQTNTRPAATDYVFYDLACATEFPPAAVQKRQAGAANANTVPDFVRAINNIPTIISSACSCIITSPAAPVTKTASNSVTRTVTNTVTNTVTTQATVTAFSTAPTPAAITTTIDSTTYG